MCYTHIEKLQDIFIINVVIKNSEHEHANNNVLMKINMLSLTLTLKKPWLLPMLIILG